MLMRSRQEISLALADKFGRPPGTPVPLATVDDWIEKAKERIREVLSTDVKEATMMQLGRLFEDLIQHKAGGHRDTVIQTERLLADILGTKAALRIETSGPGGGPIAVKTVLTSDEKRARAAALMAAAGARLAAADEAGDE